jgi:hypothetical protein
MLNILGDVQAALHASRGRAAVHVLWSVQPVPSSCSSRQSNWLANQLDQAHVPGF